MGVAPLQIRLLGEFQLLGRGGRTVVIHSARARTLLAHLILHRCAPQRREHLAGLLWPDSTETQARTNLRRELLNLRRSLPDAGRFVRFGMAAIQWRADAPATIDLVAFEQALAEAERAERSGRGEERRRALEAAVEACGGDLAPDCYDDAIREERERLRSAFSRALQHLIQALANAGDHVAAAHHAARFVRHDPLNEPAHRWLIDLRARNGDRAGALRAFEECSEILRRELRAEPAAATRALYARIRKVEPQPPPVPPDAGAGPGAAVPLVGRAREWARLHEAWRTTAPGLPQLVLIMGEAGIGKTRLAEEMLDWAARQGYLTARSRSYEAEGAVSYAPVIDWLRAPALCARWRKIDIRWRRELARLLPEAVAADDGLPGGMGRDPAIRQHLFEALAHAVNAAGEGSVILLTDDLQWCDQESLEWLHYLLRSAVAPRLLVLGTVRESETAPGHALWKLVLNLRERDQLSEIRLGPLDAAATATLAGNMVGRTLDDKAAAHLFQETEGSPLFIVESVRSDARLVAGSGETRDQPGDRDGPLPPKVRALLARRLAQLSPEARDLGGVCAVIGRAFTVEVLRRATALDEDRLAASLDELVQRGITREQVPAGAYDFSHDRIRESAYHALGAARRQLLHRRIAGALVELHARDLDRSSAEIAAHFDRAGESGPAVDYYHRAGRFALRLFANRHTITLLTRGLELLRGRSRDAGADRLELGMLTALGVALVAVKGYGAPEVMANYARAVELEEALDGAGSGPVLRALAIARLVRGDFAGALEHGTQLLQRARRLRDRALRVEAYYVIGVTRFWIGEFEAARRSLKRAIAGYLPRDAREYIAQFAQDPAVICGVRLGYTLWYVGRTDAAWREVDASIALARRLEHPFSLVYALIFACWLANDCGEQQRLRGFAEELVGRAKEHDLEYLHLMGEIFLGWLRAQTGEPRCALPRMLRGVEQYRGTGQIVFRPYVLALVAQTHALAGEVESGLVALDDALGMARETGEHFFDAELIRLKAELLGQQHADPSLVVRLLRQAMTLARRQGAVALELRVALSLARAAQRQGRAARARAVVRPVLARFKGRLATADLREAARFVGRPVR